MSAIRKLATIALFVGAVALMFLSIWMVFVYAPDERVMGAVQRIFYFHVPSAMVTFASVFVLMLASIGYLWTRKRVFDNLARAATELALLFCSIVLVTGPIWAKPAWGVWWTWEARLTTTLVLWLILAACLMVRGYAPDRDTAARLAAVLGILAALDVPIIYKAVEWWRGQHPIVFKASEKAALAPEMLKTFSVCVLTFFVFYGLLLLLRMSLASLEARAEAAAESLSDR